MAHHLPVRPAPDCTSSHDQQDAVLVADAANLLEEDRGCDDVAALALDGFEEDGGDLFGWEDGLEELVLDVAGALQREGFLLLRCRRAAAIGVGIADVRDARERGGRSGASAAAWRR